MSEDAIKILIGIAGAFVGALGGFFSSIARDWWIDRRETDRKARYLSARIVCILDRYVDHCGDVAGDDGEDRADEQGDTFVSPRHALEDLPPYPDDLDWRSIPSDLMYRALMLPNEVWKSRRIIEAADEISGPPNWDEFFDGRQFQCARLGLLALHLASDFRNQFGIEPLVYEFWEPEKYFNEVQGKILARRHQNQWPLPPVMPQPSEGV